MNLLSLADHIGVVENDISNHLLSGKNRDLILDFARHFPYDLTRDFGFESHLSSKKPFTDLLFSVSKESDGALILAGAKDYDVSQSLMCLTQWASIRNFCKKWITPGTLFNKYIELIWLEFDHTGKNFSPLPKLFFQIANKEIPTEHGYFSFLVELVEALALQFYGNSIPGKLKELLYKSISTLPDGGEIYHFGLLLTPEFESLRIVTVKFQMPAFINWLEKIGWDGDAKELESLSNEIFNKFDYTVYDIDIHKSGKILPKVGIECYFTNFRQPVIEPRWKKNMDWLVSMGWCEKDKIEGFVAFSGKRRASHFYSLNYLHSVNHIKITVNGSSDVKVKGYFGTYVRVNITKTKAKFKTKEK